MKNMLTPGIVIIVIGLFITQTLAYDIHPPISKQDHVITTVQICNVNGIKKYNVRLSTEDVERLDALFDKLYNKLDEKTNMEKEEFLFIDTIIELNKLNLISWLLTKETFDIPFRINPNQGGNGLLEKISHSDVITYGENENWDCEICGEISNTRVWGRFTNFELFLINSLGFLSPYFKWLFDFDLDEIENLFPFDINATIGIGYSETFGGDDTNYNPSRGWLWSSGQNGEVSWNDTSMYGNIRKKGFGDMLEWGYWYVGITDFRGTVIQNGLSCYYLGYAQHVKIGEMPLP